MHLSSLFSFYRNGVREITVTGEIVVSDGKKTRFSTSAEKLQFPARSLLKPFQFFAAGLAPEKWEAEPLYTAALGSISATPDQVSALEAIPADRQALKAHLAIPNVGYPMDDAHREHLKRHGASPRAEFHSCFSKHLGILEACRDHAWPLESYTSASHPYHARLVTTLSELLGYRLECEWVVDGCGLPTPVLQLSELSVLFQRLARAEAESPLGKIREKMRTSPEWIGGAKRVDTRLMQQNGGKLLAKEGADGLLGLSLLPTAKYPEGLGIVVKLYGGYQPFLAGLAVEPLLLALGLEGVASAPAGQTVQFHYKPFESIEPIDISPLVSTRTAVFPGDVSYSREISLDTGEGDHLTLSSCRTTLHVGAHTDAPSHFEKNGKTIDQVSLERYSGVCEVITIEKKRGETLRAKDISRLKTRRVLVRTNSFPDPEHFNEDFVALSPEFVEKLQSAGVLLVGIDTPSVDPASSKTLSAHHATAKTEMAILEGIDLSGVRDGVYWLQAVPLRLEGADASPVRALLTPLNW